MIDIDHKALAMLRSGEADVYYDQLVALIDALEEARAALEPFAKLAAPLVDNRAAVAIGLTDADFARARAAITEGLNQP